MPITIYRHFRLAVAVLWIILGASLVGWDQGSKLGTNPTAALTLTRAGSTTTIPITHTRTIRRVVKGRVRTLPGGTHVVYVPRTVVYVRSCHRTRRHPCARRVVVPAHRIRLRAATVRRPVATAVVVPVTVTVYVPTTIYQTVTTPPVTVTETLPQDTTTITVPTTITITVPFNSGGQP